MKSLFFIPLMGVLLLPVIGRAQVPTTDVPGTVQAATEVGNTLDNVKESATQVSQYQKTMSAMGTAKKNVSEFITKQQKKIEEQTKKLKKYKERVEEYKKKMEAYKAEAEKRINDAKKKVNEVKDKVDEAKQQVEDAKAKAEKAVEQAKEIKKQAEDVVEVAKNAGAIAQGAVNAAKNKVSSTVDTVKDKAGLPSSNESSTSSATAPAVQSEETVAQDNVSSAQQESSGSSVGLVDAPEISSSRKPIAGIDTATEKQPAAALSKEADDAEVSAPDSKETAEEMQAGTDKAASATQPEETSVQGNVSSTTSTVLPTASTKTLLPSAQVNTAPEAQQPTRTTFKTSSGYGMIRSVYPLAFAKLSLDISGPKGGITENDVLIVPDSVSMFCDLDYEEASEEGAYDKCLRQINDITLSKVTEEVTKEDIDNARRDISNGQVEYMAAAYFEALDIYNESMTFKNNVVDPIVTADINDVQTAWIYVKEMNQALGTRINNLNRLWARNLGIETYFLYTQEGLKTPEE